MSLAVHAFVYVGRKLIVLWYPVTLGNMQETFQVTLGWTVATKRYFKITVVYM
jgi:hypothetical protein